MENSVKSKKKGKKPQLPVSDSDRFNDEEHKSKKPNKRQKSNPNLMDENLELIEADSTPSKKPKKQEELPQKSEIALASKTNSEKKKKKKLKKSNPNLINENVEPLETDSTPSKKPKKQKLEESPQKAEMELPSNSNSEKKKKKKLKKSANVESEDASKSNNSVGVDSKDEEMNDSQSNDESDSDISVDESVHSASSFNIDSYPSDDEDDEIDHSEDEEENKKRGLPVGAEPSAELEERENRTVFVGNLPKTIERHELQKWFSKFGKVECVRLRSAPIADLEMPKKVAVIKKSFHENRSNIHAYIRYKDFEGAQNALQANCTKFGDYTLRVDHARHKGGYDGKKAVFVGNVPFNIEENSLINLFSKCGDIDGVRIIRDKQTGVGKGFAYVNFKCSSSVTLALKLDGEVLENRQLRVNPVKYNKKSSNKLPSSFSQNRNNFKFKTGPRQVKAKGFGEMKKLGPFKKSKFQGELSKRKEKRKFKKKSLTTKKHEKFSKILANKK